MRRSLPWIALFFAIAGICLFLTGFLMADCDFRNLSSEPAYVDVETEIEEEINEVFLKSSNASIKLYPSKDSQFHVKYNENEHNGYEIDVRDGKLSVERTSNYEWHDYIFTFCFETQYLQVYVPADFMGNIRVESSNEPMFAEDVTFQSLTLVTSNGKVELKGVTANDSISVKNGNGKIILTDVTVKNRMDLNDQNSSVLLTNVSVGSLIAENSNGRIVCDSVTAKTDIDLQTSNGTLSLKKVSFGDEMSCKNSNGSITGTLCGQMSDYTIHAKTSNAKCNLPENFTEGTKLLKVKNSNAKISIDFE